MDLATVANTLTINLGASDFISVTGYQHAKRNDVEYSDNNPLPILTGRYVAKQDTFSQELRLQSSEHTQLRYVAGLYYAHDDLQADSTYDVLPVLQIPTAENPTGTDLTSGIGLFGWPLRQKTDSYAAFGQLDYDLTEHLTATVGLRYSADDKDFHYVSQAASGLVPIFTFDGSKTFDSVSGKLGLQYRVSPDVNRYANYNRGAKSGGFFSGQTDKLEDLGPYKDETVDAYEAGLKTLLFGRALRANLSGFYYDYQNLQVYTVVVDGLITRQLFTNASAARIYGGELELEATPARGLTLTLNAAYLNGKYRDFQSATADYSGNRLPSAPKLSIQSGVNFVRPLAFGTVVVDANLSYRSKIYFDTANTERLSDRARTYVDTRLGLRFAENRYEAGLWGKNVFDQTNISTISPIASLGFDLLNMGPPRTFGLYFKARY